MTVRSPKRKRRKREKPRRPPRSTLPETPREQNSASLNSGGGERSSQEDNRQSTKAAEGEGVEEFELADEKTFRLEMEDEGTAIQKKDGEKDEKRMVKRHQKEVFKLSDSRKNSLKWPLICLLVITSNILNLHLLSVSSEERKLKHSSSCPI